MWENQKYVSTVVPVFVPSLLILVWVMQAFAELSMNRHIYTISTLVATRVSHR